MTFYKITVIVEAKDLGPAMGHLTPIMAVPLSSVPCEDPRRSTKAGYSKTPKDHLPMWQTRTGRCVLAALSTGVCSRKDIEDALVDAGFAATSCSPTTSQLVKEGKIRPLGTSSNRSWELVS